MDHLNLWMKIPLIYGNVWRDQDITYNEPFTNHNFGTVDPEEVAAAGDGRGVGRRDRAVVVLKFLIWRRWVYRDPWVRVLLSSEPPVNDPRATLNMYML